MKIRLIINDQVLSATLEDSLPAREFIAQLPLTLQLEDYAATEKIAQLPPCPAHVFLLVTTGFDPIKQVIDGSQIWLL